MVGKVFRYIHLVTFAHKDLLISVQMDKIGKMMGDFMSVSGGLPREFYEKVLGGETCEFLKAKLFERPCYVQKKYNQQQQNQYNDTTGKVGETVIAKKPNEPKSNKDVGDYVDYEEVKD